MTTDKNVLEVKGLTKSYRTKGKIVKAVDDISFSVGKGEVFGLLGPNGAGKTSTANMIVGLLRKDKGDIRILGKDSELEEVREKINIVSAYTWLTNVLSIYENLKIFAKLYGIKEYDDRITQLLEMFEIEHLRDKKVRYLSSGENTRVLLCKGLLNHPKLLLLDEATIGLDPYMANKTRKILKRLVREKGLTIVITTHNMQEAEELCDRIAFINHGKIYETYDTDNITKMIAKERVKITFKKIAPKVLERLKEKIEWRLKGESKIVKMDQTGIVMEIDKERFVHDVLKYLFDSGCRINDIDIKKPTLDEVFIKLAKGKDRKSENIEKVDTR